MIRQFVAQLSTKAFIDKTAVVIGSVKLGKNVAILPTAVLRGDVNTITVGNNSNVQDGAIIHCGAKHPTTIGESVSIGHGARLHGCHVGNRVLIGISAVILDGCEIGDDNFIAAGAIVPPRKKLSPGGLWVGSPARRVRDLSQDEMDHILNNANIYVNLCARYNNGEFGHRRN